MAAASEVISAGRRTARLQRPELLLSAIFLTFWGIALFLQYLGNAYASDLNVESDDPAHYVTGLMIHDYIRLKFPWPPAHFAQNYYAHYPKVAIGHWPPVFYVLQGAWMTLCGDSIHSDLVFMAGLSAAFALTLYALAKRQFESHAVGLALALLLLLIPVEQIFSSTVMADLPVALFCLWAVFMWTKYLEGGGARPMAGFAIFASLAILTKGNGYALLLVPPISIALARRFALLRDWRLWVFGALILVFCAPWSFVTRDLVAPTMQYKLTPAFFAEAIRYYLSQLFWQTGVGVSVFVLVGFGAALLQLVHGKLNAAWLATVSWILAFLAFHSLVPAGLELRYIILVLPAWLLLMAFGVVHTARRIRPGASLVRKAMVLSFAVAALFSFTAFSIPKRTDPGFRNLAKSIALRPEFARKVILVSSEGDGEGIFISELAQFDKPRPRHIVIRASRALANSDWNQSSYSLIYRSPKEVLEYIRSIPIGVLVVDRTTHFRPNQHQPILEHMIAQFPQDWTLDATYPQGVPPARAIAVYKLTGEHTVPDKPVPIEINGTAHLKLLVEP